MRDIAVTVIIFGSIPFIFRRPWIGMMMWAWVSLMNPHRLTWGFAYDLPVAMVIAITTMLAIVFTKEKYQFPVCPVTVTLILMCIWMTVTTLFAIHFDMALDMWEKVMKIQLMNLIGLYILSTRKHIETFVWVMVGSLAFYGVKGGIFTLLGGGIERVYGPEGSFIAENNTLGVTLLMTIPLIYFLMHRVDRLWMKLGLIGAAVLCGFSALGSHSRTGFLTMIAMVGFLWLKSKQKVLLLVVLVPLVPAMIAFMPDKWTTRMETIQTYEEDASAMGRINAWRMALNLIEDRPIVGGGFDMYSEYTFGRWAPNPTDIHSSHSNYFQFLGEHGIPGLTLFLLLLLFTWKECNNVIRLSKGHPQFAWANELSRMIQVSFVGYSVGGALLNIGYFDFAYFLMATVVLTRVLIERELAPKVSAPTRDKLGRLVRPPIPEAAAPPPAAFSAEGAPIGQKLTR